MLLKPSDKNSVLNNIMLLENDSLKKEINELSNINYQNYDYVLGKITIKNLYQSNSFFIIPAEPSVEPSSIQIISRQDSASILWLIRDVK